MVYVTMRSVCNYEVRVQVFSSHIFAIYSLIAFKKVNDWMGTWMGMAPNMVP